MAYSTGRYLRLEDRGRAPGGQGDRLVETWRTTNHEVSHSGLTNSVRGYPRCLARSVELSCQHFKMVIPIFAFLPRRKPRHERRYSWLKSLWGCQGWHPTRGGRTFQRHELCVLSGAGAVIHKKLEHGQWGCRVSDEEGGVRWKEKSMHDLDVGSVRAWEEPGFYGVCSGGQPLLFHGFPHSGFL